MNTWRKRRGLRPPQEILWDALHANVTPTAVAQVKTAYRRQALRDGRAGRLEEIDVQVRFIEHRARDEPLSPQNRQRFAEWRAILAAPEACSNGGDLKMALPCTPLLFFGMWCTMSGVIMIGHGGQNPAVTRKTPVDTPGSLVQSYTKGPALGATPNASAIFANELPTSLCIVRSHVRDVAQKPRRLQAHWAPRTR